MGTSESDSASAKADVIGRHRKHDAIESKSASKGVGSGTGSTVAVFLDAVDEELGCICHNPTSG